MLRLTATDDPSAELIAFVRSWFDLLASGRLAEACEQLDQPNSYGRTWTAEAIRELIADTFGPETLFSAKHPGGPVVTSTDEAQGSPYADVIPFADGSGYALDHAVPLNGEWSELTAQFEFFERPDGFAVVLHDLHVL